MGLRGSEVTTALIFGISGQDGSYLSELLISSGVKVYGVVRRNSVAENQDYRLRQINNQIQTFYGDVTDAGKVVELISDLKPDFVFNLAAQSHVRISFDIPKYTAEVNAVGTLNILEAIRSTSRSSLFYQASSSEMFGLGVDPDGKQRESTPMLPVSPYGASKLFAYTATNIYREAYNLRTFNGILFNHESPRRGSNFVTSKIVKSAVAIKMGLQGDLILGNLHAQRDWGHSRDYVRAMKMMLEHGNPDNYVVATGNTRTVKDMCEIAFSRLDLDWQDFVKTDEKYLRPQELPYLCGDASKAKKLLGWSPTTSFETLVEEMVDHWSTVLKDNPEIA